jgi:hypothetical protein
MHIVVFGGNQNLSVFLFFYVNVCPTVDMDTDK